MCAHLEDLDLDGGLTISGGRKGLRLLGGNGGVSVDESGENSTKGLNDAKSAR